MAQGLARADAVIIMNDGSPDLGHFKGPVLRARLVVDGEEALRGRRVFAFAGIGRPEKFLTSLEEAGAVVTERMSSPTIILTAMARLRR